MAMDYWGKMNLRLLFQASVVKSLRELDSPLVHLRDDLRLVLQVLHQLGDPVELVVGEVEVGKVDGPTFPALLEKLSLVIEPLCEVGIVGNEPSLFKSLFELGDSVAAETKEAEGSAGHKQFAHLVVGNISKNIITDGGCTAMHSKPKKVVVLGKLDLLEHLVVLDGSQKKQYFDKYPQSEDKTILWSFQTCNFSLSSGSLL